MSNVQASIVEFRNDGGEPLHISVVLAGGPHHVATLQPGESTRQVSPGDVEWRFSNSVPADNAAAAAQGAGADPGTPTGPLDPDKGGGKGEKGAK